MNIRTALVLAALVVLSACGGTSLPYATEGVLPAPVLVADGSIERRTLNAQVYDAATGWVAAHYYDRDLRGVDWASEVAGRRETVISQPTETGFYARFGELFDQLGDPHTQVVSPSRRGRQHLSRQGEAQASLGLTATLVERQWVVTRIWPEGPAIEAGVQVGWRVVSADGEAELGAVVIRAEQPMDMVFQDEAGQAHALTLMPRELPPRPPHEITRREDGIWVLRFDRFDPEAVAWLQARIAEAVADPPRGLILDLRDNSGGLLASLSQVVALLHREQVAYAVMQRRFVDVRYVTRVVPVVWEGPLVVLVGPGSASASELLAAGLQESGRGRVVGQRTAGAVVGSRNIELPDGGVMSLSLHIVLTAERRSLEGEGVTPDLEIIPELGDRRAGRDVVLEAAVTLLTAD